MNPSALPDSPAAVRSGLGSRKPGGNRVRKAQPSILTERQGELLLRDPPHHGILGIVFPAPARSILGPLPYLTDEQRFEFTRRL